MSIVSFLFPKKLVTLSQNDRRQLSAVNDLFNRSINIINREDLVSDTIEKYRELRSKTQINDVYEYLRLYIGLEQFILGNDRPVVKNTYTKARLRDELGRSVSVMDLPLEFRLLFTSGHAQYLVLYEMGLRQIIPYIQSNLGRASLINTVKEYTASTVLERLLDEKGAFHFELFKVQNTQTEDQKLRFAFSRLYQALYDKLKSSFGIQMADKPFVTFYSLIKNNFDLDIVSQVIEVLPSNITESDRLHYLSREELQKQVLKATQDLRSQRDEAATIVSSLGEGLLVLDRSLNVTLINHTGETLLGVSASGIVGKKLFEIMPLYKNNATILPTMLPVLQTIINGETQKAYLKDGYSTKNNNGTVFPIEFSISPVRTGKSITGAIVVFHDVSAMLAYENAIQEAKRTVENKVQERTRQLKELQNRLFTFLDKIPLSVSIFDQGQRLYFTNSTSRNLFKPLGAGKIELIKEGVDLGTVMSAISLYDSKSKRLVALDSNPVAQSFKGASYHSRDLEISLEQGNTPVEIFVTPIFSEIGKVEYVIVVMHDITEEKIVERSKDEFFSIASHELRTPLTAIRGNTAMIEEQFSDKIHDKELKEMIHDIHESTERLIGIVNDFLNTSRLEQGKMKFDIKEFNLCDVIHDVIQEYQKNAQEKKLYLRADDSIALNKTPKLVMADKNKTKEILVNLIGNAFKFTEKGGVTLSARVNGSMASVVVSDTGRGITEEGQLLLFRKFQQTGDSLYTRDTTKGTGLGLYISKMLAEGMGGKIKLDKSVANQGSVFSFDLPLVKQI